MNDKFLNFELIRSIRSFQSILSFRSKPKGKGYQVKGKAKVVSGAQGPKVRSSYELNFELFINGFFYN